VAADDYALLPPSEDPLGLKAPVWSVDLPGTPLRLKARGGRNPFASE